MRYRLISPVGIVIVKNMRGHLLILLKVDSFLHEYPPLGLTYRPMGQINRWRVTVSPESFPTVVVTFLIKTLEVKGNYIFCTVP